MGSQTSSPINEGKIRKEVAEYPVVMYTKPQCGYCKLAKSLLAEEQIRFREKDLDLISALNPEGYQEYLNGLVYITRQKTVPQIFICGKFVGGYTELNKLKQSKELLKRVEECAHQYRGQGA
ncbi:glutaredoxin family protein [Aphelenchoides avenae]|nr:glutaredoxin family protein [Aphelenchus avenae]